MSELESERQDQGRALTGVERLRSAWVQVVVAVMHSKNSDEAMARIGQAVARYELKDHALGCVDSPSRIQEPEKEPDHG